jgi:hypothetical protein
MSPPAPDYQRVIERFAAACEADDRVVAAFLAGSLARGAADAYSDVDLCLVTRDVDRDGFWADRDAFLRLLGEPLQAETFDSEVTVHFILADGTGGELSVGRESRFGEIHVGPFVTLVDKTGILREATFPQDSVDPDEQREVLRRELTWFWHDLAHAIAAIGRGHLWWALGQLEVLRGMCVNLVRLDEDFTAYAEGYDKVDIAVPSERLAPLAVTVVPLERAAILEAVETLVEFYRTLAPRLAERHGIPYPAELDAIFARRLAALRDAVEERPAAS